MEIVNASCSGLHVIPVQDWLHVIGGLLELTGSLNYEATSSYNLTISADDGQATSVWYMQVSDGTYRKSCYPCPVTSSHDTVARENSGFDAINQALKNAITISEMEKPRYSGD